MVYTLTCNPAIDYVVHTRKLQPGATNRAEDTELYFGGKGINVSAVLKELGIVSVALGFIAGFTGEALEKGVQAMGIRTDLVRLRSGNTRINVKIRSEENVAERQTGGTGREVFFCQETEINGAGPEVDGEAMESLLQKLDVLRDGDTLILAGSIPGSLPADTYARILKRLSGKKIRAVVDATKELLRNTLPCRPFLVKPNEQELGELFGVKLSSDPETEYYAEKLQELGARNVLVSMAGRGALLLDENGRKMRCSACRGEVRNSVGAGDSMVAGFVAGAVHGDYEQALKLATAAGGATAFSDGLAKRESIMKLLEQIG
ncbi:MAG: 1-phosphofructokinase [Lachnospiraceae bacterium]|nr:1-phosphofructokinase [Lachnospiraceae bacterium]